MHNHTNRREENIKIAVFLNIIFTVIEVIGGLWTNSLTILSDALHDFGDSVTLFSSFIFEKNAQRKPDSKRTFGYQRLSLLSAFITAIVLITGSLYILSRAIPRLTNPEHVNASGMMLLAVVGVIINGIGALRLRRGGSMNEKVLTWHLLEDVLGWVVVLIGSIIIRFWDIHIIDPIMTIGYTAFILVGVVKNLKETLNLFLQGVPAHIDIEHIKQGLLKINGVLGIHDVHVWSLEGETDIFTGHVIVNKNLLDDIEKAKKIINEELLKHHIEHSTIELETEGFCSGLECNNGYTNRSL